MTPQNIVCSLRMNTFAYMVQFSEAGRHLECPPPTGGPALMLLSSIRADEGRLAWNSKGPAAGKHPSCRVGPWFCTSQAEFYNISFCRLPVASDTRKYNKLHQLIFKNTEFSVIKSKNIAGNNIKFQWRCICVS